MRREPALRRLALMALSLPPSAANPLPLWHAAALPGNAAVLLAVALGWALLRPGRRRPDDLRAKPAAP